MLHCWCWCCAGAAGAGTRMVRAGEFSPNAGQPAVLPGGGTQRIRGGGAMDYAGLLSQKRAEESRFRSGWDPIGSPTGLSRSTLGGDPYIGGGGLMAAESALQRLDSFSGGLAYGGGSGGGGFGAGDFGGGGGYQGGFSSGGASGMNTSGSNTPGNAGDPGASRRTMQENYRRELMKQAEEDRARKQAEKQRDREETGMVSTIVKPSFLDAGGSNGRSRRGSNIFDDPSSPNPAAKTMSYRRSILPGLESPRAVSSARGGRGERLSPCTAWTAGPAETRHQRGPGDPCPQPAPPPGGPGELPSQTAPSDPAPLLPPPEPAVTAAGGASDVSAVGSSATPSARDSPQHALARLASSLGLDMVVGGGAAAPPVPAAPVSAGVGLQTPPGSVPHPAGCQQYGSGQIQGAWPSAAAQQSHQYCQATPGPGYSPAAQPPIPLPQQPNTALTWAPQNSSHPCQYPTLATPGYVPPCLAGGCCGAPLAVGELRYRPDRPRPPPPCHLAPPLPPITAGLGTTDVTAVPSCQLHPATAPGHQPTDVYGDDLAQQIEERRLKQERDRNNLLMYQQQQTGTGFGGDAGGRRRPHVSETSYDRTQRSQAGTVQSELQQQIADKKQREAERKRLEAEEDAALNARLEEQQRKVREEAEREQEARLAKERSRLERQRLIEEQQMKSHQEAEAMRRAARDRRQPPQTPATNDWGTWSDDRPTGAAAPPAEDLWQKPAEEPYKPPTPPPPPVERLDGGSAPRPGPASGGGPSAPPPAQSRLSPPVPALTRPAADPREVTAGPFDVPPRTRPVPRQRSLLTARPDRSLTPASDQQRSLTPASDRQGSLAPTNDRSHRSRTPAGDRQGSLTPNGDGHRGSHRSPTPENLRPVMSQTLVSANDRRDRSLTPCSDREETEITPKRSQTSYGSCLDRTIQTSTVIYYESLQIARCSEMTETPDIARPERSQTPVDPRQERSQKPASVCLERRPTSADPCPEKSQTPADICLDMSRTPADICLESQTPASLCPKKSHTPGDLGPERSHAPAKPCLSKPPRTPAKASPRSCLTCTHTAPHREAPDPCTSGRPGPSAASASDHGSSAASASDHGRKAPRPVRGRPERSHIPVRIRRRARAAAGQPASLREAAGMGQVTEAARTGLVTVSPREATGTEQVTMSPRVATGMGLVTVSPRVATGTRQATVSPIVATGTGQATVSPRVATGAGQVTEPATLPQVTGRRRWQQQTTELAPEDPQEAGRSRPPPITPRKKLMISLRSGREAEFVNQENTALLCATTIRELDKECFPAGGTEGTIHEMTRGSTSPADRADDAVGVCPRRTDEPPDPVLPAPLSAITDPDPPPDWRSEPDTDPSTPPPETRPRPQPAGRSPRLPLPAAPGQQRSPVPTPRLSRGDLRLGQSGRPALRRLQQMRRTLERQHDDLSRRLADKEAALCQTSAESDSPSPSPPPSPIEEQNQQLLTQLETQIALTRSWMGLASDRDPPVP